MVLFPLFAQLANRPVLVVGGGGIAERKIRLLLKADARITVVAPAFCGAIRELAAAERIALLQTAFQPAQLDAMWLAVAATDDAGVNAQVAAACVARRLFVNVVDDAERSTVQVPAIIDRDSLVVAVSSAGAAPMVARAVREQIEAGLDHGAGPLARLAQRHRAAIQRRFADLDQRRAFYRRLLRGPVMQLCRAGDLAAAEAALLRQLAASSERAEGCVLVLRAPTSDPGELTLNGLRALNQADVIFHEQTVPAAVLDLARRDAARHVFRAPGDAVARAALHATFAAPARQGQTVVVLHRGDLHLDAKALAFFVEQAVLLQQLPAAAARPQQALEPMVAS